jgi:hypothetical protein
MANAYGVLVTKHEGKRHLEDLSIDGNMVVEWIFGK